MSHPTATPRGLDAACRDWSDLLGTENVLRSSDALRHYGRTTLPDAPTPSAVLLPQTTEHVAATVRVSSTYKVPLYPISRGKNWGWGDACPTTEGQAILDLSALDRIVEVNEELGYAVVQPGVTQGQLSDYLAKTSSSWWFDSTAAGPQASLVGNVLERGIGTAAERFSQVSGMEVVLGDGTTVRTGYGHYPDSRVDYVARWGVGPSIDGLFSQSNLGIVTELGFWLQPKAAHAEICYFTTRDAELENVVDALRPLRIGGILPALNLFLVPGGSGTPLWFGVVGVRGSTGIVDAYREEIEAALAGPARVVFHRPGDIEEPATTAATLESLGLDARLAEMLVAGERLMTGVAYQPSPEFMLAFVGGPHIQHPTEPPTSAEPLDHDYGFYFFWSTCPALGREARALLDTVHPLLSAHGFPPLFTFRFVNGRSLILVVRIAFDRKLEDRRAAARACYREILDATTAAGYPPARMSIDTMDRLDPAKSSYWQLVRRLKGLLDPEHVLAPGRYLPPDSQDGSVPTA